MTENQIESKKLITTELFKRSTNKKDFLSTIVTEGEVWIFACESETKSQSSEWYTTSRRPKESRIDKSQLEVMPIAFFANERLVRQEFVQTIDKQLIPVFILKL